MSWIDQVLRRSPAQPLFHWRASRALKVLAYHEVPDPAPFAVQMDLLLERAHPVALDEVLAALAGRSGLPKDAVLVTFDDAGPSHRDHAVPVLAQRGIPAVAFAVAGVLGSDRPFWWREVELLMAAGARSREYPALGADGLVRKLKRVPDDKRLAVLAGLRAAAPASAPSTPQLAGADLRRLETAGVAVGNHSLTHPCLPRCGTAKIEREVIDSHRMLTELLGHPPAAFAYPNGDKDHRVTAVVHRLGYRAAFRFDHRINPWPPPDPIRMSRLRMDAGMDLERFRITLSGLHPAIHHLRGRR
jgi:peptidoglycan/xylan/chitin deacetylase (PgdA/CDA1 family)